MSVRMRLGTRFSAALMVTAVPISIGGFSPAILPMSHETPVTVPASAVVSPAPIAPTVSAMQRHYVSQLPARLRPQAIAPQTTISAGLALRTRAERNRKISVASSKGSHVWTASALADHDLPSAALRAYRHAADVLRSADPGCALPWTLLAGIGRVESDHGRYGGSVLGNDGVPRPAIVGVALNGKGPVAAIRDTDNGVFDGDRVWDRAVGPMQFIPATWRGVGRDGDGDGRRSPNDIDDAALAAGSYLCAGGGNLAFEDAQKSAIFRYNPSDYYVALVMAFERGYRTGVFVIPSPPVPPGAGDGVVHQRTHHRHVAKMAIVRHHRTVRTTVSRSSRPVHRTVKAPAKKAPATGTKSPAPAPKPVKPPPAPPKLLEVHGPVTVVTGGWKIDGTVKLTSSDLATIAQQDWDKDGTVEAMTAEFDGLAESGVAVVLSYYAAPTFKVNGFGLA